MNIPATELKHILKKLAPLRTETYQIGADVQSQDSDVWLVVRRDLGLGSSFNLHGKKLTQVANRMAGQIDLSRDGNKLILKSARAKIELEVQPKNALPLPKPAENFLTFKTDEFKAALAVAQAAASTNKSATHGGVVQLRSLPLGLEEETPSGYVLVGSDQNRLTIVTQKSPMPLEFSGLLNLEAAAAVQLMDGPEMTIGETNTLLQIESGDTTIYATKPQKAFPDYTRVLPPKFEFKISLQAEELLAALRTVEPLMDETLDSGAVALQIRDGVVYLQTIATGSTASDQVTYEQVDPDPVFDPKEISIRISASYLSGFVAKASGPVTMSFLGPKSPVMLEYKNITTIVMPCWEGKK